MFLDLIDAKLKVTTIGKTVEASYAWCWNSK